MGAELGLEGLRSGIRVCWGAGRGCCALAKLSHPLGKPRNVNRQTHSLLASLPLGGASCTHTQCGE